MRNISRSSIAERKACPRKYFYRYLFAGSGLDGIRPSIPLCIGLAVHKGMERLMKEDNIELAVIEAMFEFEKKWGDNTWTFEATQAKALAGGLLMGWYRTRYEQFMEQYEIISVEKEVPILLAPGLTLQTRTDVNVRDRMDGKVWVFNWKTEGKSIKEWTEKWIYDIQMWTEAVAAESALGEAVDGCIVEGFWKSTNYEGFSNSPLIRGYRRDGQYGHDKASFSQRKDAPPIVRFNAWEESFPFGEGVAAWIGFLPEKVVSDCFVRSRPIPKDNALVEDWLRQIVRKETDITYVLENGSAEDILIYMEQNRGQNCSWCPFKNACWDGSDLNEMLNLGLLKKREDHHATIGDE